jgi:hypothetical protein
MRYHIYFYGTGETAVVKAEDICSFVENRIKLGKPKKHKNFTEALLQIEEDLSPAEVKASLEGNSNEAENDDSFAESDISLNNSSRRSSTSSKSGKAALNKTREKKRKAETEVFNADENAEQKKTKSVHVPPSDPEVTAVKTSPEVMSRSGRKIKPKRFADFEDATSDEANVLPKLPPAKQVSHKPGKQLSKSDSPEKLSDNDTEDYLIAEVNGEKIEIPLKGNVPTFAGPKVGLEWKKSRMEFAMNLKKRIESGEILPGPVDKIMENWTKDQWEHFSQNVVDQEQKLSFFKETQLLDLDMRLKSSLSLNRADPDKCLSLLDDFLEVDINTLMLKKHPEVVQTIKKMRKYIGNTTEWNMSDEELVIFNDKAARIRSKSEHVYNKIKALFLVPNGKSFWDVFAQELEEFNKKTEEISTGGVSKMVITFIKFT